MNLFKARTENLVEQNLEKETLIYDLLIDKAFNLNQTSSIVYKACNGRTTFDELKKKHKFTDDFIYLTLDELKRNDLLAKESVYVSPFAEANRREVIKKVGLASMFVLSDHQRNNCAEGNQCRFGSFGRSRRFRRGWEL